MQTDSEFGNKHPVKIRDDRDFVDFYKHLLGSLVTGRSPKNFEKTVAEAYRLAELAVEQLKERKHVD